MRAVRLDSGARLVDVAERAGISPQCLSEIERGRKEPSSEMIAAVLGALEVDLERVLADILRRARRRSRAGTGAVADGEWAGRASGRVRTRRAGGRARSHSRAGAMHRRATRNTCLEGGCAQPWRGGARPTADGV